MTEGVGLLFTHSPVFVIEATRADNWSCIIYTEHLLLSVNILFSSWSLLVSHISFLLLILDMCSQQTVVLYLWWAIVYHPCPPVKVKSSVSDNIERAYLENRRPSR
jgi:hypothetical protein